MFPTDVSPADGADDRKSSLSAAKETRRPIVIDSKLIFRGENEVRLLHLGEEYRLRITRQGKMILTK